MTRAEGNAGPDTGTGSNIVKVVAASMAGTTVEWYDFFLYGVAAALVFPAVFFPASDPTVGTLASLGTFAIGFVARPVGGLVFGHFGDKIGRKKLLVLSLLFTEESFRTPDIPTLTSEDGSTLYVRFDDDAV